jgi:hypothetical protein
MGSDGKYVRKDRLAGGLVGLLLGDAIGVPYEFHGPDDLPPFDEIDVTPPPDFIRAHIGTPPGDVVGRWGPGVVPAGIVGHLRTIGPR